MNICCLNASSKVCLKLAPACITHRALQRQEPYPRIHRLLSSLSPLFSTALKYSPLIAAERKYHLATA